MTYSGCTVCPDTVTRSGHDEAQGRESYHQRKANPTIKQIENLGKWHVGCSTHDRRDDMDQRKQGVGLEVAGDVRIQAARDGLLKVIDEVQKEHPVPLLADSGIVLPLGQMPVVLTKHMPAREISSSRT